MTHQPAPDEQATIDTEDEPREYTRRRKTFQDWVTTTGGLLAILATLGGVAAWVSGMMPWLRTDVYARDFTANDIRVQKVEASTQQLSASVATIQRNGLLTLQLQLQQRIDSLSATMKTLHPGSEAYNQLSTTYYEASQQLAEINRQLRR